MNFSGSVTAGQVLGQTLKLVIFITLQKKCVIVNLLQVMTIDGLSTINKAFGDRKLIFINALMVGLTFIMSSANQRVDEHYCL